MENTTESGKGKRKKILIYIPLALICAAVIVAGILWYRDYARYISTDDALVDADYIAVSPKITGRILNVFVDEGDSVKQGELLVVLDSNDLLSQKCQAIAAKEQARAGIAQAEARYNLDQQSIKVQEINVAKAQEDYDRAKIQFQSDVISKEQYDHIKKVWEGAKAQLEFSKSQVDVSKSQIAIVNATVASADAQIRVIETNLKNTRIYASIDGVVAKRWLLPGEVVQTGQAVLTVVNNKKFWVNVYLEETNIGEVHLDQKTRFSIDAFHGVMFTGKIISIGSNTASQFSLIPPSNASGNFTKVTQRIPIKISIEGTENGIDPKSFNFMAGMSAVVHIIKD
ncbi:MAG: HlyD family secretion protein [Bacteroidota bacterium]